MATVSTTAPTSPLIDVLKSASWSDYTQSIKSEIVMSDEARFEANREWCEDYKCPAIDMVGPGILSTIVAYLLKGLDMVIQVALNVIYNLLSTIMAAFVAIAGPVAAAVDSVLTLGCYLYSLIKGGSFWATCCTNVSLIELLIQLLLTLWDAVKPIVRKVLEIWYRLVELYEQLMYECDCDRIAEEQYKEEVEEIKKFYGNRYKEYKLVTGEVPESAVIPTQILPTVENYANNNDGIMYIKVKMKSPPVGKLFKLHVRQTINAYNRYPYGAEEFCVYQAAEYAVGFVAWQTYAWVLIGMYFSSVNLKSLTNKYGEDYQKYRARFEYCKNTMPEPLYEWLVRQCTSVEEKDKILKRLGLNV